MIHSKQSIKIQAPLEIVYEVATTYPHFVRFFNVKETIASDEDYISVKVGMKKYGINFKWAVEGAKIKNTAINFIQTEGIIKGMRADWQFASIAESVTSVTITAVFSLGVPFIGAIIEKMMSTMLVEATTSKILNELKDKAEAIVLENLGGSDRILSVQN